jgi:hypothetical protein
MKKLLFTGIVVALAEIAIGSSAHAQDVDLVCGPVDPAEHDEDSIKQNNLPIHLHLGGKPEMTFWDGTRPDTVTGAPRQIFFSWDEKRADGRHHDGAINRQTGRTAVWVYDHFEVAECLPIKRLF